MPELLGAEEAARAVEANRSPRYCRMNELERWVDTTQYDHRKHDWFADTEDAPPLRERRPCIAYPIVRTAIDSNVDLCLGEGKFPEIVVADGDDDEAKIGDDAREVVNAGIGKLVGKARLKAVFRCAMGAAQAAGTVAIVAGARNGVPFAEIEQAKRCTIDRDASGAVTRLEVRYPYTVEVKGRDGKWYLETRLYRRVIDDQSDTTYLPQKAPLDGREVTTWAADPARTVTHGLGFCPVTWYTHMLAATTAEQIDGRAIHAHCLDEIEALDMGLSQWHRAAFYAGDPQLVETGADDRKPMADGVGLGNGRDIPASVSGGAYSDSNPVIGYYRGGGSSGGKPARRKGPGIVWHFDSPDADVKLLTLPGDALKVIQDNCKDLRHKVAESLGVVFSDPDNVRFASSLSGKAQVMLRQRQLDRCDQYRDDMADGLIKPVIVTMLRVCRALGAGIRSRAIRKAAAALADDGSTELEVKWGSYYAPDPAEQKAIAEFLAAADAVIPVPDAVKVHKLARALEVEDEQQLLEDVEAERESRMTREQDKLAAETKALAEMAHGDGAVTGRDRGGARANAQTDARSRGGSPAAAAPKNAVLRRD